MLTVVLLVCLAVLAVLFGLRVATGLAKPKMDQRWLERKWLEEDQWQYDPFVRPAEKQRRFPYDQDEMP